MTKHIIMYSGGASSSYVANYVVQKYGKENCVLLFTDTLWEDEDNYRFMEECADYIGIPITYIINGNTPEDIFFKDRYLGNSRYAPCSIKIKMEETIKYVNTLIVKENVTPILYFGIGFEESQRAVQLREHYLHNPVEPVKTRFPMIDNKRANVDTKKIIQNDWGIELPRMYKLGFSHANCAGRCVRGGMKHYANLLKVWPQRYMMQEEMEIRFQNEINSNITMLKQMSLKDLRIKLENDPVYWEKILKSEDQSEDMQGVPCVCTI